MRLFKLFCLSLFLMLMVTSSVAESPNPVSMLRSVSDDLLSTLKKERPTVKTDDEWIYRIVDRIVLPHVDVMGMSRSVIGRNVWLKSTSAQRNAFSREFTKVIVKTYASALDAYTDETVRFFPIRGGYKGYTRVLVNSEIVRRDGPAIPLDYRLILMNNQWKIYDLHVEGVSLLQSFHSQFSAELSKGKSLDQITRDLRRRNQRKS
jgi:phospholipid transport system substrate-binding protein